MTPTPLIPIRRPSVWRHRGTGQLQPMSPLEAHAAQLVRTTVESYRTSLQADPFWPARAPAAAATSSSDDAPTSPVDLEPPPATTLLERLRLWRTGIQLRLLMFRLQLIERHRQDLLQERAEIDRELRRGTTIRRQLQRRLSRLG